MEHGGITVWRHMMRGACHCGVQHGMPEARSRLEPEATYDYRDERGELIYQVVRLPGKQFRQRRPDPSKPGGWDWRLGDARPLIYRLPELLAADPKEIVYVVEGEKDADALHARGHVATCNSGGAGKWGRVKGAAEFFRGLHVVIIADIDPPDEPGKPGWQGQRHALQVQMSLTGSARLIQTLQCTRGKDVHAHLAAGGTLDELVQMVPPGASAPAPEAPKTAVRPRPDLRVVKDEGPTWGDDEPPRPASDELPEVRLGPDLHRVLDELDLHVGSRDPLLYQRANELVTVAGSLAKHALAEGTPIVRTITTAALAPRVTRHVQCTAVVPPKPKAAALRAVSGDGPAPLEVRRVQPPANVLASFLAMQDWHHVKHLRGVSETPFPRPDGSVCQTPGYDTATGYIYMPSTEFPEVPDAPTQDDARAALAELQDVFCDFPYVSKVAAIVPISAILSTIGRAAIDGPVPAHLFDATVMGSGKTIQCDVAHLIATGRVPAHVTWPAKDEDQEKLLSSYALSGPSAIVLDNVKGLFGGAAIEQTLTSMTVEFRILGASEIRTLPWRAVVMISGNNLDLTDDMIRRTLLSRLESPLEDPTTRTDFKHPDLLEYVAANRARLAIAALTILRAYAAKGFPSAGVRMASYSAWARVVASAIVYAGGEDATKATPPRERAALDDAGGAAQLVACWPIRDGEWSSLKAVIATQYPAPKAGDLPHGTEQVREAIEALCIVKGPAGPETKSLAKKLSKVQGRWFGNRRLVSRTDPHTCALVWRVEKRQAT
jgi:putative DNA primase/helicase